MYTVCLDSKGQPILLFGTEVNGDRSKMTAFTLETGEFEIEKIKTYTWKLAPQELADPIIKEAMSIGILANLHYVLCRSQTTLISEGIGRTELVATSWWKTMQYNVNFDETMKKFGGKIVERNFSFHMKSMLFKVIPVLNDYSDGFFFEPGWHYQLITLFKKGVIRE